MPRDDSPWEALRNILLHGPADARLLRPGTRLSQSGFSRLVARNADEVVITGRTRNVHYALRRPIRGVDARIPLYEIATRGKAERIGSLHPVYPDGFCVVPEGGSAPLNERFYGDIPFFLNDMRPAGFLGRLAPRQHPELDLPRDSRYWSSDVTLRYWTQVGWNLPGNLIAGDRALGRYFDSKAHADPGGVSRGNRSRAYDRLADDALAGAPGGSSAAGEQPKFLVHRDDGVELLVKFSPPRTDPVGRASSDLLVAEHVALD